MVLRKLTIWGALAAASVLESIRRKDLYVAAILAVIFIAAAATLGKFGVQGLETFLKSATLTVVNALSVILAVLFAARQLPEEISRRTVYPLLARPISRFDLLFGKFLGATALSSLSLLLFSLIAWGAMRFYGLEVGIIFWQWLLLRLFSLGLICALTMALSTFLTPQATVTVTLLLALGSQTFSSAVLLLDGSVGQAAQTLLRASYFVLPQLNLFDLSGRVAHGWKPIDAWVPAALFLYGLLHTTICLSIGTSKLSRQAL